MAGLRADVVDLDGGSLSVVRTVVEVAGKRTFKPFPKSTAGRRTVPLPRWVVAEIRDHMDRWPEKPTSPIFANELGGPLGRTIFRSRVWRPSLVRAGLLGSVVELGPKRFRGSWTDPDGTAQSEITNTHAQAVQAVARGKADGLRFHDLRHSYATWLVDDGVPPNMVQRVLGHERSSTTLDLYTRRTDNSDRILAALDEDDQDDDDDKGPAAAGVRQRA